MGPGGLKLIKLIVYKDIAVGKFSNKEYEGLCLRAVKNFIDKNIENLKECDGSKIRCALADALHDDFLVIDFEDRTVAYTLFYPNVYTYIAHKGDKE